ncbi:30S ribosomal protein S16 [Candidatus Babeliales bacterium]|nr:30S ribosomal protein S16 [Candidatus Babeliales bacterium]MBP9843619.1 30S ribosomal protein S16 [Candidatus Babeliales bacterium]
MAVKIRFTRVGKKHAPVYRIVAIDSRKKRDGEYLENLGTYNPLTKEIVQWHTDRIAYWESKGAIVTDAVKRLQKIKNKQTGSKVAAVEAEVAVKVEKKAAAKPAAKKATATKAKTADKE